MNQPRLDQAVPGGHKPRLVILQTHPIQYYAPLYQVLAQRGVVDVHVLYLTDAGAVAHLDEKFGTQFHWDIPLLDGYPYTVLQPGTPIQGRNVFQRDAPGLVTELERLAPDWILIYGYSGRYIWKAVAWAKRHGVRVGYSSDSNIRDQRRGLKALAKQMVLRPFFRMIDACFATSEANGEYLASYGVDPTRIHRMPFTIDVARFAQNALPPGEERPYAFIWAGKLDNNKRCQDFLAALQRLAECGAGPMRVAIAGDGVLRASLENQARDLPENCSVDFLGFVNQAAMPATLQLAAALAFTSEREAYGLIATEAAAGGLALVVADNIGCVGSTVLAQPGVNALTYRSGDVGGLAAAMKTLLEDVEMLHRMQAASIEIAKEHSPDVAAQVIERVVVTGGKQ